MDIEHQRPTLRRMVTQQIFQDTASQLPEITPGYRWRQESMERVDGGIDG